MPSAARSAFLPDSPEGGAEVIPIGGRAGRVPRVPRQDDRMDAGGRDPQAELTETIEALFMSHGLTLTNPAAAEVYRLTVSAVEHLHTGARDAGAIGQEQYETLRGMTEGLQRVPDYLSPNV